MSEVIVRMKMPKNCAECGLVDESDRCVLLGTFAGDKSVRIPKCPIVGVLPDEHGRLVDADACSSVLRKLENEAKTNTEKLCYRYAARMFEEAFTIIAAERKDDADN